MHAGRSGHPRNQKDPSDARTTRFRPARPPPASRRAPREVGMTISMHDPDATGTANNAGSFATPASESDRGHSEASANRNGSAETHPVIAEALRVIDTLRGCSGSKEHVRIFVEQTVMAGGAFYRGETGEVSRDELHGLFRTRHDAVFPDQSSDSRRRVDWSFKLALA